VRKTRFQVLVGTLAALAAVSPAASQVKVSLAKPDAESAESFTQITSVRELPSGKVLLSDSRDKVVQLLDLTSGTMTKVGREGQGPGEYGLPRGLYALPTGETLLYDMAGQRLMTITPDGKPGSFVEMPRPPSNGQGGPMIMGIRDIRGVDSQGRLYFQGSPFGPNGASMDTIPIMRWDRVKPTMDTVGYFKGPQAQASGSAGRMEVRIGGGKIWTPQEAWDVAGDGRVARVMPSPYRVVWYAAGKPTAGAVQPYTPIKVTQAEKDLFLESRRRNPGMMISIGGGGNRTMSTAGPPPNQPPPEFEETMPPFAGGPGGATVVASPDGEVWVARTRPASDKIPTYDVFDKTGALVKKVSLNPNSRVVGFGKGTVYVVRMDEDDLQYLQRYKKP
jgi:hypothetical protein